MSPDTGHDLDDFHQALSRGRVHAAGDSSCADIRLRQLSPAFGRLLVAILTAMQRAWPVETVDVAPYFPSFFCRFIIASSR